MQKHFHWNLIDASKKKLLFVILCSDKRPNINFQVSSSSQTWILSKEDKKNLLLKQFNIMPIIVSS